MNGQTSEALLSLFDSARLRPRYWVNFSLLSLITVLEFFDFAIVAFLLAVLGPQWHLTYGQSAVILYSGGCRRDLRRGCLGQPVRRLGPQEATRAGHVHLRHRRRRDRAGAARRVGHPRAAALCRGLRAHRGGDALPHAGRGDGADAVPHRVLQLLHRVRDRRRAAGLGDIGDIAGPARLARRGDAGCGDDPCRHRDRARGAGIGALARRQGSLCRGARAGGARSLACRSSRCRCQAGRRPRRPPAALPSCTGIPRGSGRR